MSHPLQLIRVISEGRPGHENQSAGLAFALARRTGAWVEVVRIPPTWNLLTRCRAALSSGPTRPQLVIGAGHKVHLPLWFAARKFHARSVVIMEPTWPKRWFDLCILPRHDTAPGQSSARIIVTLGALNRIPEDIPAKQPQGLMLIGGPSRACGWDAPGLIAAITTVIRTRSELAWTITDSRRTPAGFLEQLGAVGLSATVVPHQQTPAGWVPAHLLTAAEAWVTADSVSMIFEAVTARARTGVIPVPAIRPGASPVRAIQTLIREGYATTFDHWQRNGRQLVSAKPLQETGRCAELVLERLSFHAAA
ncbi:MAG TPA: ELM1/GtrOC1 family putative glycosyltransferase [Verrucomicrobiota bacterium]|nr:ELM1/GtrOC1 family putative glycosyltransferase [Verrucomicrobiota bacterium]HNT14527.1 ELM1/GtrOC1 family putative glycosyltransferase [Verrucomicrobiota bacterium]